MAKATTKPPVVTFKRTHGSAINARTFFSVDGIAVGEIATISGVDFRKAVVRVENPAFTDFFDTDIGNIHAVKRSVKKVARSFHVLGQPFPVAVPHEKAVWRDEHDANSANWVGAVVEADGSKGRIVEVHDDEVRVEFGSGWSQWFKTLDVRTLETAPTAS